MPLSLEHPPATLRELVRFTLSTIAQGFKVAGAIVSDGTGGPLTFRLARAAVLAVVVVVVAVGRAVLAALRSIPPRIRRRLAARQCARGRHVDREVLQAPKPGYRTTTRVLVLYRCIHCGRPVTGVGRIAA